MIKKIQNNSKGESTSLFLFKKLNLKNNIRRENNNAI